MDSKLKKLKGFTIIELLVVIVIISVLGAISVPAALTWIRDSRIKSANSNAQLVYSVAQDYLTQLEIKNTPLTGTGTGFIGCASDESYGENFELPDNANLSVYGALNCATIEPENFGKSLGDAFTGAWVAAFNKDTYTVICAWWKDIPSGGTTTDLYQSSMTVFDLKTQESHYSETGELIGQFPIY